MAQPVWKNNRLKNKFNSSVLYQGYIYGFDEAILECFDPKTGDVKWKGGRYGYGQLLLAGGYLVITTEQGELVLVRDARRPPGIGAISSHRGQDLEHPGNRQRPAPRPEYRRDGLFPHRPLTHSY